MSDVPYDTAIDAVLWQKGAITDLGRLPGDAFSIAWAIGEHAQTSGQSTHGNDTNGAGAITGQAFDPLAGEMPAIELILGTQAGDPACKPEARRSLRVSLPQSVRDALKVKCLISGNDVCRQENWP